MMQAEIDEDGLKAVHEISGLLLKKQASPKSVAVETGEGESRSAGCCLTSI